VLFASKWKQSWLLKCASSRNYTTDEVPKEKGVSVIFHGALFSLFDNMILEAGTNRLSQNISITILNCIISH